MRRVFKSYVNKQIRNYGKVNTDCVLGRGGFGTVYEVIPHPGKEKMVLKVIHLENYEGEEYTYRLTLVRREVDFLRKYHGSNRVRVTKLIKNFESKGIDGKVSAVFLLLKRYETVGQKPMSLSRVCELGVAVCSFVCQLHRENVLFRDLKPSNLYCDQEDFLIGDFGSARTISEFEIERNKDISIIGSPPYIAPEILSGKPLCGYNSDLYSLGITLEELAMSATDSDATLMASLRQIIEKATKEDPFTRYRTADDMLVDLKKLGCCTRKTLPYYKKAPVHAFADESNIVEEPKRTDRQKNEKRRRVMAAFLKIILLVLIAMCSIWVYLHTDLNKNKDLGTNDKVTMNSDNLNWSAWSNSLPTTVTADAYDIETRTLYRCREKEETSSTEKKLPGWELEKEETRTKDGYTDWSEWDIEKIASSDSREVEKVKRYRFSDKITTSSSRELVGWTPKDITYSLGDFGEWSEWSSESVIASDSRKVESKKQYRYRTLKEEVSYTDWVQGDWTDTEMNTDDLCELIEARTVYPYYYFYCTVCGTRSPYHGYLCKSCHKTTLSIESGTVVWHVTPWSASSYYDKNKYSQIIGGEIFWNWDDGQSKTQYRYQTRTQKTTQTWTEWSDFSDSEVKHSETTEVQTRVLYRYCDRMNTPTYYYESWGEWNEWSETKVVSSADRRVEEATFYRFRDKKAEVETVYVFERFTDWSKWGTTKIIENGKLEVQTKKEFRYKRKANTNRNDTL